MSFIQFLLLPLFKICHRFSLSLLCLRGIFSLVNRTPPGELLLHIDKTHSCFLPIMNQNGNANVMVVRFNTSTSFTAMSNSLNSPTVIFNSIAGLTNQLLSQYQAIFVGKMLNVPVEIGCFLEINCNTGFFFHHATCPKQNNSLVSVDKVFNLQTLSRILAVQISPIKDNYIFSHKIDAESVEQGFDRSIYEENVLKGRTSLSVSWAYYKSLDFTWLHFVSALQMSVNSEIVAAGDQIMKQLGHSYHCVHIREEGDFNRGSLELINTLEKIAVRKNQTNYYIITRKPLKKKIINPKILTKFCFGNYGRNIRSLMLDACVCSSHQATHFSGLGGSTLSLLIASMRTVAGLHTDLYGFNYANQKWYKGYFGDVRITYKSR